MNKSKTIVTIFVIMGLLLTVSSMASIAIEEQGFKHKNISFSYVESNIEPQASSKQSVFIESISGEKGLNPLPIVTDTDIQITNAEGFDFQPTIASGDGESMVLGYIGDPSQSGDYGAWFISSIDGGATWIIENSLALDIEPPEKPTIDYWGENRFVASWVPGFSDYDGSAMYILQILDPANPYDSFDGSLWTWYDVGSGYYNFKDISLACDNAVDYYAWGGASIVGDHGSGLSSIPMFSYQATEDGTAWIYSFSDIETGGLYQDCQGTATDIDPVTHESYSIWNFMNGSKGVYDIYFYKFDFSTWDEYEGYPIHPGLAEGEISSDNDDQNVDVSCYNDNIIIVSQNNGDITCYYSYDGLENMSESTIVNSDSNEEFPRIIHIGDKEALCVFTKDGNLYSISTEDGGATWGIPVQVNDEDGTVMQDDSTADICKLGIVWTDDRAGNYDIFFDVPGVAVSNVVVDSISGGFGVSAQISNLGSADANDVPWTIGIDGGFMLLGKTTEGIIDVIPAGESVMITTGFILGIGNVDITVSAAESQKTASGTVILPLVLGIS